MRRLLAERRRSLPWSDGSILLVSLLLVLIAVPLWLDPQTLSEVAGQGAPTPTSLSTLGLATPRPDEPTPPASLPQVLVAEDAFSRSVDGSWGTADLGGDYSAAGAGTVSVEEGSAFARLQAGDTGAVALMALNLRDAALEYTVSLERLPSDGEVVVYGLVRLGAHGAAYRLALHVTAAGETYAAFERLVDGRASVIGTPVLVPTVASAAPPSLRIRAEVMGDDPTTLRMRAWTDGQPEPSGWQLSQIDWTGGLQRDGAIGIGWWLDQAANDRLALGFLDLAAWRLGSGAGSGE